MPERTVAPPARRYTMKPAMVVGALAVVILVAFSVGSALTKTAAPSAKVPDRPSAVAGSSLKAVPASGGLSVIEADGQPPANVLDAIALPEGAVRAAPPANPGLGSTYDREVTFSLHASQAAVLGFYKTELEHLGWRTVTSGAASHQPGEQIVDQIAGADGFYWQLGVIVAPSTFGANGTTDITRFTLRVLQVDDQQ